MANKNQLNARAEIRSIDVAQRKCIVS